MACTWFYTGVCGTVTIKMYNNAARRYNATTDRVFCGLRSPWARCDGLPALGRSRRTFRAGVGVARHPTNHCTAATPRVSRSPVYDSLPGLSAPPPPL